MKKKFNALGVGRVSIGVSIGIGIGLSIIAPITYSQSLDNKVIDTQQIKTVVNDQSNVSGNTYPFDRTFIISAYYSPLAGQAKYVTGSFDGDVRLNGEGVHSADGTIVYPGMVAAPKNYPFGTKMKIPGIGTIAVHDRGGAIVNAGTRNQAFDRLDVWMGYGDIGLRRALNWGRRTVDVTVYGINNSIQENVYLEGYSQAESVALKTINSVPKLFASDLSFGDEGEEVKELQQYLQTFNYYDGTINGKYDAKTENAVVKLQQDVGIIDSKDDFGAGYFGPETRRKLEYAVSERNQNLKNHLPLKALSKNDQGDDVKNLQESLKKLGYDIEVTGIYDDRTVNAIFKFQKDTKIVISENDTGAGAFGPRTLQVLASEMAKLTLSAQAADTAEVVKPVIVFKSDLALGDQGEDVKRLQQELYNMNLLAVAPSGLFGKTTEHAVFKFQQTQNIIKTADDVGAGVFGPATRDKLHQLIGMREQNSKNISKKSGVVAVNF